MSWRPTSLGDCIELVSGAAFKSAMFTDNKDDIPLVKGENIGQGKILWDKSRYWPATQFEEYSKLILKPGDIVLAMDRPWVTAGLKYAIVSDRDPVSLLVQRVARIRPLPNADAKFLKHVIGSKGFLEYIKGVMGGTNVPHISGRQIRDFKCQLPDLETQQRIASILSAYDDLIENNRRRIALLEEAARQLYKEWFVRFRFPGHEHVKIIDGVPEGWERKALRDVATLNYGKALKEETRVPGGVPVYGSSGIVGSHDKALVNGPGIILGRKGNVGSVRWSHCNFFPIDTVYFIASDQFDFHLYLTLQHMQFMSTDVAVPGLNREFAYSRSLIRPSATIGARFEEEVTPIFLQIQKLTEWNEKLAKARDLLLPKLMSGAITV